MVDKIIKCIMCGRPAEFIDKKTKEPLCRNCALENENIHRRKQR